MRGAGDISWIELGHATDEEIRAMTDGEGHMSVPFNYCGTVYALAMDPEMD